MSLLSPATETVRRRVDARLEELVASLPEHWPSLDGSGAQALGELVATAATAVRGGKRMRALLLGVGASLGISDAEARLALLASPPVVAGGCALELYQASALVHDDIIDAADTRRGNPAAHRALATTHSEARMLGDATAFGVNGAILLGDMLLSLAGEEMGRAQAGGPSQAAASENRAHRRARELFDEMTVEVALGQYLDVRAELTPLPGVAEPASVHEAFACEARAHAMEVVRHKSARYSVMYPLLIGTALAGVEEDSALWPLLAQWGEQVGIAFQLRDDELGALGDATVTGKPVGEDLREGKRTVLLALTWERADRAGRELLTRVLANPQASAEDLAAAQELIRDCGAAAAHEAAIDECLASSQRSLDALVDAGLSPTDAELLNEVGKKLTQRTA